MSDTTKEMKALSSTGERVKQARVMAGLTRREMQQEFNINTNTVNSWEINRNKLTAEGAKRLSDAFFKKGICCSEEWLLYGIGKKPEFSELVEQKFSSAALSSFDKSHEMMSEEEKIMRETFLFESHYKEEKAKVILVPDDSMEPFFCKGDFVGGFLYEGNNISSLVGYISIILTKEGEVLFRKFLKAEDEKGFHLAALNVTSPNVVPIIYRENIVGVAPVVWHRKKVPLVIDL